jgi:hypothetical protein
MCKHSVPVLRSSQPLILAVQAQHDLHCLCSLTEDTVRRGLLSGVGTALRDALAFGKDGLQLSLAGKSGLSITEKQHSMVLWSHLRAGQFQELILL